MFGIDSYKSKSHAGGNEKRVKFRPECPLPFGSESFIFVRLPETVNKGVIFLCLSIWQKNLVCYYFQLRTAAFKGLLCDLG